MDVCAPNRWWNKSLAGFNGGTLIKGDVLILRYKDDTHQFHSFTGSEAQELLDLIRSAPLSACFPSMKDRS